MTVAAKPDAAPTDLEVEIGEADSALILQDIGLQSQLDIGKIQIKFRGQGDVFSPLLVNGEGTFATGQVDASKIPVLARLEKMARDTNLAKAEFDSMQGRFRAENGLLILDQVETLPKDSTRITARGKVDQAGSIQIAGTIHAEGGVIGSIGNFLEKIGLKKEDQSLIEIPFRVTGSINAPVVELHHREGIK
jgi:hypothetical protein